MLQIMEETVELALVPKEHEQRQTDDRLGDFFVPQSLNHIDRGGEFGPTRTRAAAMLVDFPVPPNSGRD